MVMVGDDLLEHLRIARSRLDFVKDNAQRWSIPCGDDVRSFYPAPIHSLTSHRARSRATCAPRT